MSLHENIYISEPLKTRSTTGEQTSATSGLRSLKQFNKSWNNLATNVNDFLCIMLDDLWKFHEKQSIRIVDDRDTNKLTSNSILFHEHSSHLPVRK